MSEQLGRVLVVDEDNVFNAALVEEGELVKGMGELGGGVFGAAFEPFDTLSWTTAQPKLAVELCNAESV